MDRLLGRSTPTPRHPEGVLSFTDFIQRVNPRYVFYRHAKVLIDVLQQVADDKRRRVMVFMPPRHGKSELVSRLFPAYYLYRHPERFVGINSYAAELAYTFSRNARDNYVRAGGALKDDASAVKHWETGGGGGLWAAGVGGPITGKGFHLGIIDDPLKNAEDARSETIRNKQWDWYDSTFYTREEPGAAIVVVQTRWHEDDLSGRMLARERDAEQAEGWHVVNFEAIKSSKAFDWPEACTVENDGREPGEPLCPDRVSLDKLEKVRSNSPSVWSALYQQRPSPPDGDLWKRECFLPFDVLPEGTYGDGYDWDTAYTEKERLSASAYVRSCTDDAGNVYIVDIDWRWLEFPDLVQWMKDLKGPHYIEKKATGKSAKQSLDREKIYAVEVEVQSDKVARTNDVLPVGRAGKLYVRRPILERLLDDEKQGVLRFPNGTHDDLNDALTQAVRRHTEAGWLLT